MKRVIGYHWVKRHANLVWEIGIWNNYLNDGYGWTLFQDNRLLSDDYFYKIDPIRISDVFYPKE